MVALKDTLPGNVKSKKNPTNIRFRNADDLNYYGGENSQVPTRNLGQGIGRKVFHYKRIRYFLSQIIQDLKFLMLMNIGVNTYPGWRNTKSKCKIGTIRCV